MGHPLTITVLWVLTGCVADIKVTYKNGYTLTLVGWPTGIRKWWKAKP